MFFISKDDISLNAYTIFGDDFRVSILRDELVVLIHNHKANKHGIGSSEDTHDGAESG